ncbi:Vacuolar protein sorting-associated protein 52 [Vanrija albida]|uniref:Vacuolar protein sorting-associated protein 52 n=1 Tax=Vanrija albida TaxID=181172 RepID=A0ABR3QFT5_9TREE
MSSTPGGTLDVVLETPGAGPSRPTQTTSSPRPPLPDPILNEEDEDADREEFLRRQKEYVDLERSVDESAELLTSLASYLTTFQDNLSDVSGQISDLQARSDEIERQLKGRRVILPPLNALLSDLIIPPSLVLTLRDTEPAQNPQLWLQAIAELEDKMVAVKSRGAKVKAARELEGIIEALALKAIHQLPPFLLKLIRPLRSASKGLSTNLAVMQTSLLLKYQPFYAFLLRQSPRHAKQVERGYVNAARAYYETGLRRYARALGQIRLRTPEKPDLIGTPSSEEVAAIAAAGGKTPPGIKAAYDRLRFADLDVEGQAGAVILAYQADDKELTVPAEALFRSLGLVLLDNASAEFTFIVRFFARAGLSQPAAPPPPRSVALSGASTPVESPPLHTVSEAGRSRVGGVRRQGVATPDPTESLKDAERIWTEVFGSALESCTSFFNALVTPTPLPAIPLLTVIRLNDHLIATAESRGALPLISYLTGWKLQLWPVYRKAMDAHIESLKRLADEADAKGLSSYISKGVKDATVSAVAVRYAALFGAVSALSDEAEEAMIFSSMTRLRTELVRLIQAQSNKIKDVQQRQSFTSSLYELVARELVAGPGPPTHPRMQAEVSFFRTREEQARRRTTPQTPQQ